PDPSVLLIDDRRHRLLLSHKPSRTRLWPVVVDHENRVVLPDVSGDRLSACPPRERHGHRPRNEPTHGEAIREERAKLRLSGLVEVVRNSHCQVGTRLRPRLQPDRILKYPPPGLRVGGTERARADLRPYAAEASPHGSQN